MTDLALYYPYIHVRDDAWLKAAALYWPRLGRLAPRNWPRYDSEVARALNGELGFLVNVDPRLYAPGVSAAFQELLRRDLDALRARYALPPECRPSRGGDADAYFAAAPPIFPDGSSLEWLHLDKVSQGLVRDLVAAGLAVEEWGHPFHQSVLFPPGDGPSPVVESVQWLGMHPALVRVYSVALADAVAEANRMRPVTDQDDVYGALSGWTVDELAAVLLADEAGGDGGKAPPRPDAEAVAASYAVLAVRTVVPKGLEHVPVKKVIKARRALAGEFHAFRAHLEALAPVFAELAEIPDPAVLRARLELLVERELTLPTADLERALTQLGLEPAKGVLSLSSPQLPALAGAALTAAGLPPVVGQAGHVAAQLVGATAGTRRSSAQQRRTAAGYLLGLRERLEPRGVVDRFRRLLTRA
ncbi:hypothetical protein SAMN05421810_1025 [Amycolatopsis arida]|uniref:Uncharacterized protein n=1 Tax=Amycolatopsis arida TaxID=587909 RepID=A0A1I5NRG2_9PSEU|nr:DUF6236 family protein [Amycolatopsis arida]TDX98218.1 hypothetical protein CLV69_1015 [Amycolatopsis arida]SFP24405.1 hypothetical protein SAMN05421810_1025 [Amycolatopsis arida]